MDDVANARARGERGEEDPDLLPGGCDGGLQIERDEDGERGGLRLRAADVQLATVPGAEQFPVRSILRIVSGDRHDAHGVPELSE